MKITATPEARLNDRIWKTLQEIQEKSLIYGPDKPIQWICEYEKLGEKRMHEEAALIGKLKDWGVIKLDQQKTVLADNGNAYFYIERAYPLFQYAYSLFAAGYKHQTEPSDLLNMLRALSMKVLDHEDPPEDIMTFLEDASEIKSRESKADETAMLDYNPETGIGYNGSKKFKLKDGSPEYRVFSRLYANLNKRVHRFDVLELVKFYEDGQDSDPTRKTAETAAINDVAKSLRDKAGLTTEQLVMNNGNLTLLGSKIPNSPQADPK